MHHVMQLLDANLICNNINIAFADILFVTEFVRYYCKNDDLITVMWQYCIVLVMYSAGMVRVNTVFMIMSTCI